MSAPGRPKGEYLTAKPEGCPVNSSPPPRGFEGSYLGDAARLPAAARLECKICWWVYDPAQGDPVWQVAPGTAFSALPPHWRCPQCDGDADQFMVLPEAAP